MIQQWLVNTAKRLGHGSQRAAVDRFHPNSNGRNSQAAAVVCKGEANVDLDDGLESEFDSSLPDSGTETI